MGRTPCCDKANVKKGPWSSEEDAKLKDYIDQYGTGGNWITLPQKAGLKRCGKSCRLRWLNYLRPDIKHGEFSEEEDQMIYSLYANIGSRWSIIASQLPGRTDNDIKNHWNTKLKKKLMLMGIIPNHQSQNSKIPYYHEALSTSYCSTSTTSSPSLPFMDYTSSYNCNNNTPNPSITSLNSVSSQLFEEALAKPFGYKSQGKYDDGMLAFGSEGSCIDSSTYGGFGEQIYSGNGREIKQEEMDSFQYFKMSSEGLEGNEWTGKLLCRHFGDNNVAVDYDSTNDVKKLLSYGDLGCTINENNMEVKPMYEC